MLSVKDEIVGAIPGFKYPIADPGWRCGTPDRPGSIVHLDDRCHLLLGVQLFLDVGAECDTSRKCE